MNKNEFGESLYHMQNHMQYLHSAMYPIRKL